MPGSPIRGPRRAPSAPLPHHGGVTDHSRSTVRAAAQALAAALLVVAMAACGDTSPTRSPAPTQTTAASTAAATATLSAPTALPTEPRASAPDIYPVPSLRPPAPADAPAATLNPTTTATLDKTIKSVRSQGAFPGIAVSVVFPDGSMWTGASGSAVLSSHKPVTADTLFSVGSISKTFVAALALRLAERGTIGLDDPLSRYVPTYPNASHITLRQLLDHQSGIRDVFTSPGMADAILSAPSRIWTVDQVLARIGKPYFAPGRSYRYSNTNYILLGVAIEKATGQTIASLVRSEFLDPLGLKNTWFQPQEKVASTAFAHGYMGPSSKPRDISAGQKMLPFNSEATVAGSAGGFVSTAPDLARWAAALYGGGVLDEAALASMIDVSATLPYKPTYPYGFGFERTAIAGRVAWGHRGHLDGFWSAMWYLPDSRITIVVLTNDEWTNTQSVTARFVQALLGK
jgi:D-alanyl-D-alanine carboxypeptidase